MEYISRHLERKFTKMSSFFSRIGARTYFTGRSRSFTFSIYANIPLLDANVRAYTGKRFTPVCHQFRKLAFGHAQELRRYTHRNIIRMFQSEFRRYFSIHLYFPLFNIIICNSLFYQSYDNNLTKYLPSKFTALYLLYHIYVHLSTVLS